MQKQTQHSLVVIMGIMALCFFTLSIFAKRMPLFPGDLGLTGLLQSLIHPVLTGVMEWTSRLFTSWPAGLIVFFTGLLLFWRLGKLEGVFIWTAGLLSLFDDVVKMVISRPRPSAEQVEVLMPEIGSGFPSGHACFSILFLGFLAFLLFNHIQKAILRILSLTILIILILLVGASRIYLGDHWFSDVLGGYVLGGFFLAVVIWSYGKLNNILRQRRPI